MWDAVSFKELATLSHPTGVSLVTFSHDGTHLATLGADNLVRIYPLDLRALLELAKQRVTRELTPDECQSYHVEAPCAPAP